jgi:hypothetical protein
MSLLIPFYDPVFKATDNDGLPLVGGQLFTYAAGTLIPQATYTDAGGGTAQTNPIVLDENGQAALFLGNLVYKFVLEDANGVIQWTADQISGITTISAGDITGTIPLGNLPDYPLSRIVVDVNPKTKFFYQEVDAAGTAQTQRPSLNFLSPFVITDDATIPATVVGLGPSGVTAGTYTSATVTVDALGRLTSASNGATFPARVDDSNGSSLTFPDGTKMKWGVSAASPTGVSESAVSVTFPGGAFTVAPSVTCTPDNNPDGSTIYPIECHASAISVNGFTVNFTCPVLIGGGGASNITNVVHACWEAKGH